MHTALELVYRDIIYFVLSIIKHRLFIKVLAIHPLQQDSFRGRILRSAEVMAALNFKFESIPHVSSSVNHDSEVRTHARTHLICPVVFMGDHYRSTAQPGKLWGDRERRRSADGVLSREWKPYQHSVEVAEVEEQCQS